MSSSNKTIKLYALRERVEDAAQNVTYVYRALYILVSVGLAIAGIKGVIPFWPSTVVALLGAVALDLFEYVATIISSYMKYRKFIKEGKSEDDEVDASNMHMNTMYWYCWTLKVVFTIAIIVTLGFNLYSFCVK